jgi:hypothetical protein
VLGSVILVLLTKTLPQFTVGRNKCSADGAKDGFVVGQHLRITESKTSAGGTTQLGFWVEANFNVVVESHDLVYRHSALDSVRLTEPIPLSTVGSGAAPLPM